MLQRQKTQKRGSEGSFKRELIATNDAFSVEGVHALAQPKSAAVD